MSTDGCDPMFAAEQTLEAAVPPLLLVHMA